MKGNDLGRLAREEHNERESRRENKRKLRRGKKTPKDPSAGRDERKANARAGEIATTSGKVIDLMEALKASLHPKKEA